jgi:hypothetical protein
MAMCEAPFGVNALETGVELMVKKPLKVEQRN